LEQSSFPARRVAVLGAGVMGAQIAAHLANCNVAVILFELPAREGDPNGNVTRAIDGLKKLEPSPLAVPGRAVCIRPANYEQHLALLADCDLVIEAIAERLDWKIDLYRKVAPHLNERTIFASNTSGLSIARLAEAVPEALRPRFCGVHFFNPPRYMHLVELIPAPVTDPAILDRLEGFLVTTLGKGVVRAKDTPNFIANRVGIFSMLAIIHHAERLGLPFDLVDALTGPAIGRPKSATFRTADVVGLDTFAHVINTMRDTLPDDPWHRHFVTPAWLAALIGKGALGQKTKCGIYRKAGKSGKEIQVLDLDRQDYRTSAGAADEAIAALLKIKDPAERFAALRASDHPQAQFLWAIFRDLFHYCATHLEAIADNARDLDLAVRWGFGWDVGPFELWQAAGWQQVAGWIAADIAAGATMASPPLPVWAIDPQRLGVHGPAGSYSPSAGGDIARSSLPVYRRQVYPPALIGETRTFGETVFEDEAVRLWHGGDGVAVLSFNTRMHVVSDGVLDGIVRAVAVAERDFRGLVIWQAEPPFSYGANLKPILPQIEAGNFDAVEAMVAKFQRATTCLKYALVPTVAAVQGMALGGGCEIIMHCARAVAALESYIGLVEVGVGLLPAGGGTKEYALRSAQAAAAGNGDHLAALKNPFQTIAMGTVARSAEHAREIGYLRTCDIVIMNPHELLHVARKTALAMHEAGYRPALPVPFPVAGRTGIATLQAMLTNMRAGGFISEHDCRVGSQVAKVLCGGEVDAGSLVDEAWIIELERAAFMELLRTPETQARIAHTLTTGKPLRN
jgi:3-hydroxyacyl-CoA dehydrogenase